MHKVLITPFLEGCDYREVLSWLEAAGCELDVQYLSRHLTEEELIPLLPGVDGVIASGETYNQRTLAVADRLKVIARTGVGYDAIDLREATRKGIVVTTTPGLLSESVADLTMGLLITLARRIPEGQGLLRKGAWDRPIGAEVNGKTIGIAGLGAIGQAVARRARHGFRMQVLYWDQVQRPDLEREVGAVQVSLEQLLHESDFVTLHIPLFEDTRNLINEARLRCMKKAAYLINTSRGAIVDEAALFKALSEHWIAGAALDVYAKEPPWGSPLLDLASVVLTPHVGATTHEVLLAMAWAAAKDLVRVLRGERPLHPVNPEALHSSMCTHTP